MLDKLPVFRTYAALRHNTRRLETATTELQQLRDQVGEVASLKRSLEKRDKLIEQHHMPVVSPKDLKRIVKARGEQYRGASPFPHLVLDNFLDAGILRRVVSEVSAMDHSGWHRTASAHERKLSTEDEATFGPFTRRVFTALNSSLFVTFLEELTGINGLIADPHLRGGGLHEIERGGRLGVHADFNFYKRMGVWRRLNVLVYLNLEWDESWGGHLEFWDREGKNCMARVVPTFNRAVIFDTSSRSFHGHPHPLDCPEGHSRKSLALYYYTVDYPYPDDLTPHSTVFVDDHSD